MSSISDKHGVWFLGGDRPADLGQAGMKTKLRTCAAPGGGDSQRCQEGVGAGRGCGCRFDKLDFRVWALGLGLVLEQNPRKLAREESAIQ